ncbi:hypothetical protein ACEQPO_06880 [Bacillus sp. SL00103]
MGNGRDNDHERTGDETRCNCWWFLVFRLPMLTIGIVLSFISIKNE